MNILRFQTNTPTEVALNSPQGTIVEGRYGERVLFHLTDGRVMYVPPIVARKIEDQRIAPGEPFELCKTQVKNGRLRSIEWWLRRTHAESPEGEKADRPAEPSSDLESQFVQSIAAVNGTTHNGHPLAAAQDESPQNGSNQTVPTQTAPLPSLNMRLKQPSRRRITPKSTALIWVT